MKIKNYFLQLLFLCFVGVFNVLELQANTTEHISERYLTCEGVTQIQVTVVTINSATVNWTSTNTANSWSLAVGLSSDTDPNNLPLINATSTSKEISDLLSGTEYKVWVRSNCNDEGTSEWVGPILFKTDCLPISNFNENFDTTPTLTLPSCWSKILRGENLSIGAKIQTATFAAISSPNAIEMVNWMSSGTYDMILVSPNLSNLSAGTHRLRFTSKAECTLEVGSVNTATNSGVFTLYQDVISTNVATEHVISFDVFEGTDTHIAIRLNTSAPNNHIYLDNFIWEEIPPCPDVTNIIATATTASSANFIWTPGNAETSWDVAIGASTVTDPSTLTYQNVLYENTTTASYYNATNLETLTTYKIWVRSVCENVGNGAWIGPVLFTTNCIAVADFNETFESTATGALPTCWSKILRGDGLSTAAKVTVNEVPLVDIKSVGLSNFTSTGTYDIILVSPLVSTLSLGNHRLRFYAKFASTFEVGTVSSNTNAGIFTELETVTTTNGLAEYLVDFSSYTGTDQHIGIRMRDNAPLYSAISLDNMVWEAIPDCPEVLDVNVPTVYSNSAIINWTSTPAESSWDVVYGATTVTDPNTLSPTNTLEFPYELTGLTSATTYNVWVRAVCGSSNGTWIGPVEFTTECAPVETFIQNFDAETLPALPLCWSKILRGTGLSQFAYINTSTSNVAAFPNFTAPNYIQMAAQGSQPTADIILVSHKVSSLSLGSHRLKFDSYYPGSIQVGTLNGNTATAVFTPIQTVESGGFSGASHVINFSSYTGPNTYIGIRLVPDTNILPSINIDNIVWEPIPECPDVTQIAVPNSSQTGATITWNAGESEISWQLAIGESTVSDPNTVAAQAASATTLTVEGLTAATNYKVWVRSVCANENGAWIGPIQFLTPCIAENVPYTENFQSAIIPDLPTCTTSQITYELSNNWVSHNGATNFGFPTKALRYYDAMASANAWFFTRALNLVAGQSYTISYKKGTNSNLSWLGANLKVMYGSSPYAASMTTTLADHVDFYGMGVIETVPFTVAQTGVYYFSFNVYSNAYASSVFLDDIVIQENLSTEINEFTQLNYYPNPVTSVLNVSSNENITSVILYNILGQKVLTNNFESQEVKIDMSALSAGTYIAKIIANNSIKTIKVIKK